MRIRRLRAEALGQLRVVELDLDSVGPGVVALAGPNGGGKTHIVEALLPLVLYLRSPSYGDAIQHHFSAHGGRLEVGFVYDGNEYQAQVRGVRGRTPEAYLSCNGALIAGPKVTEYRSIVASLFPAPSTLLASVFAAQRDASGLVGADAAQRRAVFCALLKLDRFDHYLAALAEWQKRAIGEKGEMDIRLGSAEGRRSSGEIAAEIAELRRRGELESAQLRQFALEIDALSVEISRVRTENASFVARRTAAEKRLRQCDARLRAWMDGGSFTVTIVESWIEAVRVRIHEIRDCLFPEAHACLLENEALSSSLLLDITAFRHKAEEIEQRMADIAQQVAQADVDFGAEKTVVTSINDDELPCRDCGLLTQAQARLSRYTQWQEEHRAAWDGALARRRALRDQIAQQEVRRAAVLKQLQQLKTREVDLGSERALLDDQLEQLQQLRLNALAEEELAEINAARAESLAILGAVGDARAIERLRELTEKQRELDALQREAVRRSTEYARRLGGAEKEYEVAKAAELKRAAAAARIRDLTAELEDWAYLKQALKDEREGRLGALCPRIARYAARLLSDYRMGCFGVDFDGFVPFITDRRRSGERCGVSGGEQAMLCEALRTAICLAVAEQAGLSGGTLIRDEMTGALDADSAIQYVQLLHQALALGRFYQVVYICHQEAAWTRASAVFWLENGKLDRL